MITEWYRWHSKKRTRKAPRMMGFGKWTVQRVVAKLDNEEITRRAEMMAQKANSTDRFHFYQRALTEITAELSSTKRKRYEQKAKQWQVELPDEQKAP